VYLLHCTWRCNILCSKHDIDEWNRHALFLSWNGRNRYLHSSLLKIWDFFHSFRYAPLVKRRNFSHSWKKSQIFNRDSCKNLLVFTLNFLPYKPTGPVSSNIYRPTNNSTGPNLKTTLMTINSNHQNSKHDDVPNVMWTCKLYIR
jgi:hypothetical protein